MTIQSLDFSEPMKELVNILASVLMLAQRVTLYYILIFQICEWLSIILLIHYQVDRRPEEILYSHNHESYSGDGLFGNSYMKRELAMIYFFKVIWWVLIPVHIIF